MRALNPSYLPPRCLFPAQEHRAAPLYSIRRKRKARGRQLTIFGSRFDSVTFYDCLIDVDLSVTP